MDEDYEHCLICGQRAEYRLGTEVRGIGHPWQTLPTVYPLRSYCLWHFMLILEFAAMQEAKYKKNHPAQPAEVKVD